MCSIRLAITQDCICGFDLIVSSPGVDTIKSSVLLNKGCFMPSRVLQLLLWRGDIIVDIMVSLLGDRVMMNMNHFFVLFVLVLI